MRARLSIVAIVAFVVVDAVLTAWAFRHVSSPLPPRNASSQTAQSPGQRAPTPSATPKRTAAPQAVVALDIGASGTVLRATQGVCGDKEKGAPSEVSVSTNQGRSFRRTTLPGLVAALRVQVESKDSIWLIGADRSCRVLRWTSTDDGRTWTRAAGAGGSWHLSPDRTQRTVFAPGGSRSTPCLPASLSTLGNDVVRVLCRSGDVLGTTDGGATWLTLGRLEGGVSIRFDAPGSGLALAADKDCPAAVMTTSDGGTSWSRVTCLRGGDPRVISSDGDLVGAQIGSTFLVSRDGGKSWGPPRR